MNLQKRINRNLLGTAADLPTSTWPPEWRRRTGAGFSGADLIYVSSNDTQRRYVYLYGEAEAAIEFDLPIDLLLTAEGGYQVRFLYQPTQRASENPRVVAYFNAGVHFWTRELQTSTAHAAVAQPGDWLICDDSIDLNDANTQPKALLALQSGLFDPLAATDATTEPENDQQVAQEPGWPLGPGELHFSGKALGTEVSPEMAEGVSVFVHLKPLALSTNEPKPEFGGARARYWVEKGGRTYMPICRGGGTHVLTLPVTADCGWAGAGIYIGTSAYASFTDQSEAGQAGLQVIPTDPDADDEAQHIAKAWDIRNDADEDDLGVNGRTATLCFESVYHAAPYEALACIVGPYKLDITDHRQPDYWPSVEEGETIDLQVKVNYAVSGKPEPGVAVEWRHGSNLLETELTGEGGWAVFSYQPTADATVIAVVDSPYKPEADTQDFVVKTIPTRLWAQFELSVDGTEISPDDHWWILPGQSYQLTLKPRAGSVLIGQDLALAVDPAQSLQLEPTGARPLAAGGLTWRVTTAADASGAFALRLDCRRFKQPPILNGTTNKLPALTIDEAPDDRLDPMAAVATLTAVVPHYNGMLSTDEISVTWTGAAGSPAEGSHTTSPIEVGTIGEKTIPLPVSVIAFSLGKPVTVSYTVIRDGSSLPASDPLTLPVGVLPQSALEPSRPRILEAAQEGNGAELDVGTLTGNGTLRINSWPLIAAGQYVWLRLKGFKPDNLAYDVTLWEPPNKVSSDWVSAGFATNVAQNAYLRALKDGSTLTVEFKASFNQSTEESQATPFPPRTYTIRAVLDLRAPSIKQATGTAPTQQLNPVAAKDALTVVIPDYGVQPGDQVSVTWAGTAEEGSYVTTPQALPPNREIAIPIEVIAFNLGRSVTVSYTVTRNNNEPLPSDPLNLAVQTLAEDYLLGAKPKILQAANQGSGTELDLNSISANATCWVGIWPLIAPDQDVWLRLKGTKADGTVPYDLNIWAPPPRGPRTSPVWIDQGSYEVPAAYSYLKELKDGSTLTMEFKADLSKTTNEANAITFPLRTYTVKLELAGPTLDSVKDASNEEVEEGELTVSTTLKLSGLASEGQKVEIFDGSGAGAVSKGQTTADLTTGIWTHNITVVEGERRLYAKALYPVDGSVYSNVRKLKVVALVPPTLDSVKDDNNEEVQEGELTVSTRLKLSGQASKGQKVEIFDGSGAGAVSKGQATADRTNGIWTHDITVAEEACRLYAKSLYHSGGSVFSNVRKLTVVALVKPTIVSLKDANDKEVPADILNRYTVSTRLKLSGQASRGQKIEIVDGWYEDEVFKGQATANSVTGTWECTLTVAPASYSFFAKSLYHSGNPVYSTVRHVNVVPLVIPTLESVRGTGNQEVPDGEITFSTSLTLRGKASRKQTVEIFEGSGASAVPLDQATGDVLNGSWMQFVTLAEGPRRLYVKSLYHSGNPVYSNVRTLIVTVLVPPTLESVKDANGREVQDFGNTSSTTLKLSGKASKRCSVEIFEGTGNTAVSMGVATGNSVSGSWTITISIGRIAGGRRLYAKSLYHSGNPVYSNVRNVIFVP
ncbi:hypothetical protein [Pseudomonas batumici]|uniref:Uncharacterized protein n=1 Tax=Pseudomonas batumici TaxID=226910 RepID=A0A0C2E8X7_9PSED|nr:hypothetical protein [Pseudomonas batumici]KIH82329.1 hypothetical protein UCMB321_4005 [Pseudomonas batumici]